MTSIAGRRRPDRGRARLRVRGFAELDALVARLERAAAARGHRAVLVLRPDAPADLAGVKRWIAARPTPPTRRDAATRRATPRSRTDPAHRVQRLLGREHHRAWVEIGSRADGVGVRLAAALGAVRAGGLAVLVVTRAPGSPLARRLIERLARVAAAPGAPVADVDLAAGFGARERVPRRRPPLGSGVPVAAVPTPAAIDAQRALLGRAWDALAGARSTVVLLGARGRGKSALAGLLHARVAATPAFGPPLVTSALRGSIDSLARHATGPVRFAAPDAALRAPATTLFVDEAATLPARTLARLLAHHERVVLATTVDGHESAGRAFAVRLRETLGPDRADATVLEPARPMRWRDGDPLERALGRALLLDAMTARPTPAPPSPRARGHDGAPRVRRVASRAWRADEGALRALVRLLAATHYQSALNDIEHVLGGALEVHVAELDGALAGVALVAREGGIDARLAPDVIAGRRRLPDQLLPQLLARAAGDGAALGARYARVVRIAVLPHLRRAGVGSALLRHVGTGVDAGARPEIDAVGASFAAEPDATAFWLANGYRRFHEGSRVNPRSGTISRAVLRPAGGGGVSVDPPTGSPGGATDGVAAALVDEIAGRAARRERGRP